MPIHSTIGTGLLWPNSFGGPFITSGGQIVQFSVTSGLLHRDVYNGTSWTRTNLGRPDANTPESFWAVQVGDVFHLLTQTASGVAGINPEITVSNTPGWVVIQAAVTTTAPRGACCLVRRSTGELVAFFQGPEFRTMGTGYAQIHYSRSTNNGATWTAPTLFSGGTTTSFMAPVATKHHGTDNITAAYKAGTYADFKELSSANAIGTVYTADIIDDTTATHVYSSFLTYPHSTGENVVEAFWWKGDLDKQGHARYGTTITRTATGNNLVTGITGNGLLDGGPRDSKAVRGTDVYSVIASTDGALRFDVSTQAYGHTTFTNFAPAISGSFRRAHCNVYTKPDSSVVLGYTAYNATNTLHYGEEVITAAPPVGTTPPTVTATADGNTINLSWTAVANASSYDVERDTVIVATTTTTAHSDSGLAYTTTYAYRVRGKNSVSTGSWSTAVSATTGEPPPPTVDAGADIKTAKDATTVTLTGTASDPAGGTMTYQWTKVSGGVATINSPTALSTTVTLTGGGEIVFRLSATSSATGKTGFDDVNVTAVKSSYDFTFDGGTSDVPIFFAETANGFLHETVPDNVSPPNATRFVRPGNTTGRAYARVLNVPPVSSNIYTRFYCKLSNVDTSSNMMQENLLRLSTEAGGVTVSGSVGYWTGRFTINSTTSAPAGSTVMPMAQWFRIETRHASDAAGALISVEARLFLDPASTIPTETLSGTFTAYAGNAINIGVNSNNSTIIANNATVDNLAYSETDWIGPLPPGTKYDELALNTAVTTSITEFDAIGRSELNLGTVVTSSFVEQDVLSAVNNVESVMTSTVTALDVEPIQQLTEKFIQQLDADLWDTSAGATVVSGRLRLPVSSSTDWAAARGNFDIRGGYAFARVSPLGASDEKTFLEVKSASGFRVTLGYELGNLRFYVPGGTPEIQTVAYDTTNHKWVKIREVTGTFYADASADGLTWTNQFSSSLAQIPEYAILQLYSESTTAVTGYAYFDNLNVEPPVLVVVGPAADSSTTGIWRAEDGRSTNLYTSLSETVPNDATYVLAKE